MIVVTDYILVYFMNEADYVRHLRTILQRLHDKSFYAKISKCELWLDFVSFLGHVVTKNDTMVCFIDIATIHDWATPTSSNNIRCFILLIGYKWCFTQTFSSVSAPLTKLTQRKMVF